MGLCGRNYAALYARCRQLASVLTAAGLGRGDTISVMLLNTPAMIEAHYGVPMSGAVLHSLKYAVGCGDNCIST
jgi:fatty-acyl-CoA synthase